MTTPHKHHDLIVAWAKGAKIQWYLDSTLNPQWVDCGEYITWVASCDYRIKPEPKPDRTQEYQVEWPSNKAGPRWHQKATLNLVLTFDGETGVLKKAEVI